MYVVLHFVNNGYCLSNSDWCPGSVLRTESTSRAHWLPATPLWCQKPMNNFWLPPNLTTNSLLLTRSLTNNRNSWFIHILYVTSISIYILCFYDISNFFLKIFFVFLGYTVHLWDSSQKSRFPKNLMKKSTYKQTYTVQTGGVQGQLCSPSKGPIRTHGFKYECLLMINNRPLN